MNKASTTLIIASLGAVLFSVSSHASSMAFDGAGNLFVGTGNGSIFKLTPDGKRSTFASGLQPEHLAFDRLGNLFVSDRNNQSILKLTPDGKKSTFAIGTKYPVDLTFDDKSSLFVLDKDSNSIFKFMPDGKQSTFASGLTDPVDLAIDRSGNLFVSASDGTILKFTPDGTKTTFFSKMGYPNAMAIDGAGNLFVGDLDNHLILKFTPDGEKSTFVTEINPSDLACDPLGNLLTPEGDSNRIFQFAPDGTRSTFPKGATSPDNQWEYRWPAGKSPVILKAGTTHAVLDLSKDLKVAPPFATEAMVVWAPDSNRFAFNFHTGSRHFTTALYQLRGDKWVALRSPETDETNKPLERVMAAQLRELGLPPKTDRQSLSDFMSVREVREWIGPNTVILNCSSSGAAQSKNESEGRNHVAADFLLTLKFDAKGNWKIVKTHQIPSEPH
ncbi:MAG TPA: NHL repeat-containing protein [Candidatus Udaeobacter sp.]|nr:NHL repeat-containing protein [Candidatus Udaeobacter sp.]